MVVVFLKGIMSELLLGAVMAIIKFFTYPFTLITPSSLSSLIRAGAAFIWSLAAIAVVFLFKNEIRELLGRLKKFKGWGLEGAFHDRPSNGYPGLPQDIPQEAPSTEELAVSTASEQPTSDSAKWGNSGNLFWAGHDLMFTIDVLLRGAPRESIAQGLRQSLHHVRQLDFEDNDVESRLAQLKNDADRLVDKDWTQERRVSYAQKLQEIIWEIGSRANNHQPGFDPRPRE